jgi:hypothetical protein
LMEKLQGKDCTYDPREKSMKGILLMIKGEWKDRAYSQQEKV